MSWWIWIGAVGLYGVFRLWYDGLRRPLSAAEVDEYTSFLEARAADGADKQDLAVLRKFMEEDDGKEFIMVNLVRFNPSPVKHPDTGKDVHASSLLLEYFRPLMKMFLKRAGHPVLSSQVVGGYLDAWNTPPDPGWHVAGLIRYRSRRDAVLATMADAEFDGLHKYKFAALQQTFAIPTHTNAGFYASPRLTVALVLALTAALLQIAITQVN